MKILRNDSNSHNDMMAYMESFNNNEFSPYVGIFWYQSDRDELFGVNKVEADLLPFTSTGLKTTPRLHKQVWAKEYNKYRQSPHVPTPFYQPDYTKLPRGRVFQRDDGRFEVMVGSWIQRYPQVKQLITDEFELPANNTSFIIDSHWNIGNGWEGDK